jgi:3-deoxy-manno-octulosonate cytidylyltransferase (CMP-KDO synthetase)
MTTIMPRCYGIIPARYGSSRFPGKPLADIAGKPMFWHVYHRAAKCAELSGLYLATDDKRILEAARNLNVPAIPTRSDHSSGSDRVFEACAGLDIAADDVVINIQGDEPLLDPLMLNEMIAPFADPSVAVTTPVRRMEAVETDSPDRVKAVFTERKKALYFSRSKIPFSREEEEDYYCHIGMYAFRKAALESFVKTPPSRLETIEKLEQLRLLENGIPIHVVITECESLSVDRPGDLEAVLRHLAGT